MIKDVAGHKASFAEKILPLFLARECYPRSERSGREHGRELRNSCAAMAMKSSLANFRSSSTSRRKAISSDAASSDAA
jgi:hypothetical protein